MYKGIKVTALLLSAIMLVSSCAAKQDSKKSDKKERHVTTTSVGIEAEAGENVQMPDLINMTWDEALAEYDYLNLTPTLKYDSEHEKNVIMVQSVAPGKTIKKNQNVEVTVSNGPKLIEVGDHAGKTINNVITQLTQQDLGYEVIYTEDDSAAKDTVIRTEPTAHELVEIGTTVKCYVSTGASDKTTTVPNLVNLSLASAMKRAEEYSLQLDIEYQPSVEVEEGRIISQSIEPTALVESGTRITVVVSSGGEAKRETSVTAVFSDSMSGVFEFQYYIDGTLQQEMTEVKDLALVKRFEWTFSNSDVHDYAVTVSSVDTGRSGIFFDCTVDFTQDPPEKEYKTLNTKVFAELLAE